MKPDTPEELTDYLHRSIPLASVMGIRAVEASWDAAVLAAPCENNRNHYGIFFGGSLTSLALLAGFAVLRHRLQTIELDYRIVVRRSEFSFERPASTDVTARAELDPVNWRDLLAALKRRGKAGITVAVTVHDAAGQRVGRMTGVFALLPSTEPGTGLDKAPR